MTTFTELCVRNWDGSFGYHQVLSGKNVISTTVRRDYASRDVSIQTYPREPLKQRKEKDTVIQLTPACHNAINCVRILRFYLTFALGLEPVPVRVTLETAPFVPLLILEPSSEQCGFIKSQASLKNHVLSIMSPFACSASTPAARVYFSPESPGVLKYKTNASGRLVFSVGNSLKIPETDLQEIKKFQEKNFRVTGFVKTPSGFAINWGTPCKNGHGEESELALLASIFNPAVDEYFCASRC